MSNILPATAAAAADKAICSTTTTNGGDEVRAQNVSGLKLPKPKKKYKKKIGCTGCTAQKQPESNLHACRRQPKLFVAPKREIERERKIKGKEEK